MSGAEPVDPQELRAEIERARADLGGTIEELAARVNVVARVRRAVRLAGARVRATLRTADPSVTTGALAGGALGLAAGLIYLSRRRRSRAG